MARFKVGDRVLVRTDLQQFKSYPMRDNSAQNSVNNEMIRLGGREVTIKSCYGQYKIKEDRGRWSWTDLMFDTN